MTVAGGVLHLQSPEFWERAVRDQIAPRANPRHDGEGPPYATNAAKPAAKPMPNIWTGDPGEPAPLVQGPVPPARGGGRNVIGSRVWLLKVDLKLPVHGLLKLSLLHFQLPGTPQLGWGMKLSCRDILVCINRWAYIYEYVSERCQGQHRCRKQLKATSEILDEVVSSRTETTQMSQDLPYLDPKSM